MDKINNRTATRLLNQAFKVLSKQLDYKIHLNACSSKEVCILTEEREIARISNSSNAIGWLYEEDSIEMLKTLMRPCVGFTFYETAKNTVHIISFAKMFGTTLEELMVNLDLANT